MPRAVTRAPVLTAAVMYLSTQIPRLTGRVSVKIVVGLVVFGLYRMVCTSARSCADLTELMWRIVDTMPSHAIVRYKLDDGKADDLGFYTTIDSAKRDAKRDARG